MSPPDKQGNHRALLYETSSEATTKGTRDLRAGAKVELHGTKYTDKTKYMNHIVAGNVVKMPTMQSNRVCDTRAKVIVLSM